MIMNKKLIKFRQSYIHRKLCEQVWRWNIFFPKKSLKNAIFSVLLQKRYKILNSHFRFYLLLNTISQILFNNGALSIHGWWKVIERYLRWTLEIHLVISKFLLALLIYKYIVNFVLFKLTGLRMLILNTTNLKGSLSFGKMFHFFWSS